VELRLFVDGHVSEIWSKVQIPIGRAMFNYDDSLPRVTAWLTGAPLEMVRPERGWTITKIPLPY
jgi:hypothetical protein